MSSSRGFNPQEFGVGYNQNFRSARRPSHRINMNFNNRQGPMSFVNVNDDADADN